ncbi:MAG TPA: hypothetical protein VM884_10950 [Flavisolibacter sp.]|jgi:hypothetical protein|nr:hypothetical protein [Flavisolibacter sp.]
MKRNFFIVVGLVWLCSCGDSSPNVSTNKDTVAPQGTTESTPNNPGGLQPNSGGTTNGNSGVSTDTSTNGMNGTNRDSMR